MQTDGWDELIMNDEDDGSATDKVLRQDRRHHQTLPAFKMNEYLDSPDSLESFTGGFKIFNVNKLKTKCK